MWQKFLSLWTKLLKFRKADCNGEGLTPDSKIHQHIKIWTLSIVNNEQLIPPVWNACYNGDDDNVILTLLAKGNRLAMKKFKQVPNSVSKYSDQNSILIEHCAVGQGPLAQVDQPGSEPRGLIIR